MLPRWLVDEIQNIMFTAHITRGDVRQVTVRSRGNSFSDEKTIATVRQHFQTVDLKRSPTANPIENHFTVGAG